MYICVCVCMCVCVQNCVQCTWDSKKQTTSRKTFSLLNSHLVCWIHHCSYGLFVCLFVYLFVSLLVDYIRDVYQYFSIHRYQYFLVMIYVYIYIRALFIYKNENDIVRRSFYNQI